MKKIILGAVVVAGMTAGLMADAPASYKKCAGCHGAHGEKKALGKSKVLKDMSKADIVAAINGYKDGSYGGPMKGLMKGQVAGLSDADAQAIADYIGK
jgi:cytochrome c553